MFKSFFTMALVLFSTLSHAQTGYFGSVHPDAPISAMPNYNAIRQAENHYRNERYSYYNYPQQGYGSYGSYGGSHGRAGSGCTMRMPNPYVGYSRQYGSVTLNLRQVTSVYTNQNQVIVSMYGTAPVQMAYAGHYEAKSVERSIVSAIEQCHRHR